MTLAGAVSRQKTWIPYYGFRRACPDSVEEMVSLVDEHVELVRRHNRWDEKHRRAQVIDAAIVPFVAKPPAGDEIICVPTRYVGWHCDFNLKVSRDGNLGRHHRSGKPANIEMSKVLQHRRCKMLRRVNDKPSRGTPACAVLRSSSAVKNRIVAVR